jgi:hypothetical protein
VLAVAVLVAAVLAEAVLLGWFFRESAAGVLPLKKWIYMNGPAMARTTTTARAARSQRSQWRGFVSGMAGDYPGGFSQSALSSLRVGRESRLDWRAG